MKRNETEREVDRHAPIVAKALDTHGRIYRKTGEVRAERAARRTPVATLLRDGTRETANVAEPGDYIVTNPGGERYVVKPKTFESRYAAKPGEEGVYLAKGSVVAVQNPYSAAISTLASWGEKQHGAADCMIADIYDPETGKREGEPYLISPKEFESTYIPL